MTQIGIIGTGSMGKMLVEAFIESGAVNEANITIHNRSKEKAEMLKECFSDIQVAASAKELTSKADILFICVKPYQIPDLLQEIKSSTNPNTMLVSITSPVKIESIEAQVSCKVARAIPSLINQTLSGPTLLSYGERCNKEDRERLSTLLSFISQPLEINEDITRVSSDIASCGPAFFSYMTQCFIDAAVRQTSITEDEATELTTNMLIGLGKIFEQERFTLSSLQERICVPGGITGVGIEVLKKETGTMFDQLFIATHNKFYNEQKHIEESFYNKGRLS